MRPLRSAVFLTLGLTLCRWSAAQDAAPRPATPAQAPPATGSTPGGATTTAPAAAQLEPRLPEVTDPMLEEPPEAPRILKNWQEALSLVRQDSTSLRTMRARIQRAEANSQAALAPALPTLTGNASLNRHLLLGDGYRFDVAQGALLQSSIPDPATTWNAGLALRVPLLNRRAWHDRGTAEDAIEATRLDAREVERQTVATLANAIVGVVTAERLAEITRVSLKSALSTLELNRRRAQLGAASTVDVLRTEQEVSASRAQVLAADETLMRAREALGTALGSTQAWGVRPDIRLDSLAADARAVCTPEASVESRPDVRAARASVHLAERDVTSVGYDFWPTVDGVSNATYWSNQRATPNGERVTWTIGAVLSWPLYDGGVRYAARAANRAEVSVRQETLTETKRAALLEVAQARRGLEVAGANLQVVSEGRRIAAEAARLARVGYLNGNGTSFDLVDTAQRLRETEIDLAVKEFELLRAKIAAFLSLATCRV